VFRGLIDVLRKRNKSNLKIRIHYVLVKWNNRLAIRRNRSDLLYFSFGRDDFRSKEIREALNRLGCSFIEVMPRTSFRDMLRNMFRGGKEYYYGREPSTNRFGYRYDLAGLTFEKSKLFKAAIEVVERAITSYLIEYGDHSKA